MITYDAIKSANERVNRMEISRYDKKTGKTITKHYACVSERVQAFREICPNGSIETSVQLIPDEKGMICLATTVIKDEDGRVLAQDNAMEREGSTQINATSFVENACTSSIGRAAASLGLGSETSMASAEEMCNALNQQGGADVERETLLSIIGTMLDGNEALQQDVNEKLNGRPYDSLPTENLRNMKRYIISRKSNGAQAE